MTDTMTAAELSLSEHQIQAAFFSTVEWMENLDPRWATIYAIPNGGHRTKCTAAKMKREGVRRGVPDIFVSYPAKGYHGAYIEVKRPGKKPTKEQKAFLQQAFKLGYYCTICYSSDEIQETVEWYFGEGAS